MEITRQVRRVAITSVAVAFCAGAVMAPSAVAQTRSIPKCMASDLSAKETAENAGMSQPASLITLTNISGRTCSLKGYATITEARTKKGPQEFTAGPGLLENAPNPKPKRVVLKDGDKAFFGVGTATAYDPPFVNFTRLTFSLVKGGDTLTVKVGLPATAPKGQPFPLGVSAFARGVGQPG
jgi:hypothetical protein